MGLLHERRPLYPDQQKYISLGAAENGKNKTLVKA